MKARLWLIGRVIYRGHIKILIITSTKEQREQNIVPLIEDPYLVSEDVCA
jgi:hypothetical protein